VIDYRSTSGRTALLGFAVALVLAWACYRPALSGAFQLDDVGNLGGLAHVSDFDSALDFVLAGRAGPLGRPIALATFAWQAGSWQHGAAAFLKVNLLIHLFNAVLVAVVLLRLALCMSIERSKAMTIAALAASTWVLMPLLATSSLLVVQRMTTLSATFVLLGLTGYLLARVHINAQPRRALIGMSGSLLVGTLLAILCKESGLLLPVFALVLEATVLAPPNRIEKRHWQVWRAAFLIAPLLLILGYLAWRLSYPDWMVLRRDSTAGERLLTETRVLWVYLFKAVFGMPYTLGIFQTPTPVARSLMQPLTLLATVSWLAFATAAIYYRRRYSFAALAVLWYLAGHILESTSLPLELYFEHRNYLPVIGPLFALCAYVLQADRRKRIFGVAALIAVVIVNASYLYVFASLWGEPSTASRHWAIRYPDSVRAVTTMASFQLTEEGPLRTLKTIDDFVTRNPQHGYLRIQELNLLCQYAQTSDHGRVLEQLHRELPYVDFTFTAGTMVSQLFDASVATDCSDVKPDTVASLATILRDNPRYAGDPYYNQFHEKLLAAIARYQGNFAATIEHLRAAIALQASSELNMMMVTALADAGGFDAAREFIDDARAARPAHPLHAMQWRRDLDGLRVYVDELEKVKQ